MPKIIGCSIDGNKELCTTCPHKEILTECKEYRNRYGAEDVWSENNV